MLLNMDAELQHLISVSMEKMTSGANSSIAGRGGRKSGAMDLRKALLVAHFLQEVRCAYFEEDYEIISNTIKGVKISDCDESAKQENQNSTKNFNRCREGKYQFLNLFLIFKNVSALGVYVILVKKAK